MKKFRSNETGFSAIELVLIIVIVVLIGISGWLVYKNHHKNAAATISTTSTSKAATSTSTTPKSTSTSTTKPVTTTVFQIPELGIEITVPNSIKDIVYKVDPAGTLSTGQQTQSVTLSTQTLTNLDSDCSVNGSAPPLGTIYKTTGQYPSNPDVDLNNSSGGLVKQFSTYYIGWSNPQGICGTSASTQSDASADTNLFSTALHSTVQPIQ
jgi:hypothetical protein